MLSSITWAQYISAILIIAVPYYLYVGLRYYKAEISAFFTRRKATRTLTPFPASISSDVMGAAKADHDITIIDDGQLMFAPETDDPADAADSLVSADAEKELMKEIDGLIEASVGTQGKAEFIALYNVLVNAYQPYREMVSLPKIAEYAAGVAGNKLSFELAAEELPQQWK